MSSVVLAKALYDNVSEADDELSFKKGDVITVLETDFEGMTGWWLCSLGDKQGVAPGNRLQLLSYGNDDVVDDVGDIYDTPGKAHKQKFGDVDYDIPMAHNSTLEYEDYAIPKSRYGNIPAPDTQRHGFVLPSPRTPKAFDIRNSDSSDGLVTNEVYDAPSRYSSERSSDEFRFSGEGYQEIGTEEMYDVPSRNSLESDDGGGTQTYATPNAPILPPKNIHNQDNQDIYDSPAAMGQDIFEVNPGCLEGDSDIYDTPALPGNDGVQLTGLLHSLSVDKCSTDPEEVYDVPPTAPDDIYDVPAVKELTQPTYDTIKDTIKVASDGNNNPPSVEHGIVTGDVVGDAIYDELPPEKLVQGGVYDNFEIDGVIKELEAEQKECEKIKEERKSGGAGKIMKFEKSQSNESDDYVDYQEIYGMGNEEAAKKKAGEKRASVQTSVFDRIHMDKVRELRISHSVAMTNLDKLQQAVDVAVTKLLSFVTEDWRQPEILILNVNGIRDISGKVKVALRLLTEFGLGALLNSQNLYDNATSRKIRDALEPLLETYYSIKSAIQHLDETNWRSAYQMTENDELNCITSMAQGIPCDAYNLGAVISNVSTLLFSKASGQPPARRTSSPVVVQKESVGAKKVDSEQVSIHGKQRLVPQPIKTPAPATLPKPKRSNEGKNKIGDGEKSHTESVSELTNNLLNEIEDMKQPKPAFRRQGSKRLSPKTVRRLCSIGLRNDEKIFEDASSTPPKPSRRCSSPASSPLPQQPSFNVRFSTSISDPDLDKISNLQNGDQNSLHRLTSFMEKMDSQFVSLKGGITNFIESVRKYEKPKVFVAHSKFIVLSAHKLVYVGDGASRSQTNATMKSTIATVTNSLSDVINEFVESIKLAARQYPDENAMNGMIKSAAKVTEKALELYKTLKNHGES